MLCVEELKLKLLAKSSVCPGIITIIWSLITSDVDGEEESSANDFELDDTVTELINNPNYVENLRDPGKFDARNGEDGPHRKAQVKPVDIQLGKTDDDQIQEKKHVSSNEQQARQAHINDILFGPRK